MERHGRLEIDWAVEDDPANAFGQADAARLGLTVEVLEERGPGGGWPLLRFSGTVEALRTLRGEYTIGAPTWRCDGEVGRRSDPTMIGHVGWDDVPDGPCPYCDSAVAAEEPTIEVLDD